MYYFQNCQTLADAKTIYRKLVMDFHPDKGGNAKDFIELRKQFKTFRPKKQGQDDTNFNFDKFHNLIMKFEGLDNLTVSFIGTFIWIEGDTYPQKDKIKAISLDGYNKPQFAGKKKAWYFSPIGYKKLGRKNYKLDQLKNTYGSHEYKTKGFKQLT